MITQQLTINQVQGFAQLIVRADGESMDDLAGIAEDLSQRPDVTTNGPIIYAPPPEPPPV